MPSRRVFLHAMFCGSLAACADRLPAPMPSRALVLRRPSGNDRLAVAYRRDGCLDRDELRRIDVFFRDRRSGEVREIDPALLDLLCDLRAHLDLPEDTPFELVSGYRSPATNAWLARRSHSVAENSFHIRGRAADIVIPGTRPLRVAEAAEDLRRGGYAWYRDGFTHVDTGPVRTWKT